MENLIKRATDMCKKLNIDPDEVVEVKNLTTTFRGSDGPTIVGTIIKYFKDTIPVYAVLSTSGWNKSWSCNGSKPDLVRVIRSMKYLFIEPKTDWGNPQLIPVTGFPVISCKEHRTS